MDDGMPPLTCKLESPPIKVEYDCESLHEAPLASIPIKPEEGEIDEGKLDARARLVACSSSPPPLIEDCPALCESDEDTTQLSDELKLYREYLIYTTEALTHKR